MKLIAKTFYYTKTKEVPYAYFDIKSLMPMLDKDLFVKVFVTNDILQVSFSGLVKKQLKCYYVDLSKIEGAIIKYVLKNKNGLLPPNFEDTEFDEVILKRK